jgi:hypothetical protein
VSVTLYEPGLTELLVLPTGPVGRYVTEKGEEVAAAARQNASTMFRTRTGTLVDSIGVFPQETHEGLQVEVGTDGAPYGRVLELGGEPHIIQPVTQKILVSERNNPDPLRSPQAIVYHPGPVARPWLMPALEQVFLGA